MIAIFVGFRWQSKYPLAILETKERIKYMGKTLVLAEKPSVARDIAKVLNSNQKNNGYISGSKYIITWALGHLVTLADPEAYGDKYKTWNIADLPMLPKKMELVVIKQTSKQYSIVKNLLHRDDIDELVIATDAGREGELVARWIIEKAGFRKPVKRLWISSQTDRAVKEGFAKLKPGADYNNLYMSAQSRAEADWLIGLNVTRALTCKYNAQLSAGRVQTPTLAMIIDRENEIRRFVPNDYWTVQAAVQPTIQGTSGSKVNEFTITWKDKSSGQTRIFDKDKALNITSKVTGQIGQIIEVSKDSKLELPPLAYDLTELQRDANRRYSYSAKQTLSIMQRLYENYKLVTYPRTDSKHITEDIVPTLAERLKSISVGPYISLVQNVLKNKIRVTKRLVDNSKVSDHHAIIPTEQYVDLSSLNSEERNIYDLIVKRFIAVLNPPFEYEQTTISMDIKNELFYAKGRIVKSLGWKAVYNGLASGSTLSEYQIDDKDGFTDEDEVPSKNQSLPEMIKGQKAKVSSVKTINGKTKPPARYNEATLLTAMEHPGKFVDNKALRETLEATSGLGTPATRADIIEKLFDTFYIERKGKEIVPTSKGTQLVSLVPTDLKSPELTANWEQQLSLISKGKVSSKSFIDEMKIYATKLVSTVVSSTEGYKHENITKEKCTQCGKYLLEVNGKKGKMLICQDRECGFRKTVSQTTNARCPECHKKMELRGEDENKSFFCACGYREKLETFKKRKGDQVDKKEVSKFLKQQNAEELVNSSLAEALAKWKK